MDEPFLIQTERTLIRKLTFEDSEFVYELQQSQGWKKYIGDRGVHSVQDAYQYLEKGPMSSYALNGYGLFLVQLKSGQKIGVSGLLKRDYLDHSDIGFTLLEEFEGQGYAYESTSAIVDFAFNKLGIKCIQAIVLEENSRSVKLLLKLGMQDKGLHLFPGQDGYLRLYQLQSSLK